MNEEKKIAQAILDAHKMHEESYDETAELGEEYKSPYDFCFQLACEKLKLSPNLWEILILANHWYNDLAVWAEGILE